jgi:hypothetical protein
MSWEGVRHLRCHYHPRSTATAECSVCGVGLCRKCAIQDRGAVFCDSCYASAEGDEEARPVSHEESEVENEDYIDLELMDLLDTEDDEGLL